jgi:hypothetical protein
VAQTVGAVSVSEVDDTIVIHVEAMFEFDFVEDFVGVHWILLNPVFPGKDYVLCMVGRAWVLSIVVLVLGAVLTLDCLDQPRRLGRERIAANHEESQIHLGIAGLAAG